MVVVPKSSDGIDLDRDFTDFFQQLWWPNPEGLDLGLYSETRETF